MQRIARFSLSVALKSPSRARKSAPRNSCTLCVCVVVVVGSNFIDRVRELFAQSIVDLHTHIHSLSLQSRPPRVDSINSPRLKRLKQVVATRRKSRRNFTSSFVSRKYFPLRKALTFYFINGFLFGSLLPRRRSSICHWYCLFWWYYLAASAAICGLIFLLLKNSFHTPFHFQETEQKS